MVVTPPPQELGTLQTLQSAAVALLGIAAFLLAIFPSVIKMYETSHWFREGDPSVYDDARDWFDQEGLPYKRAFDSSKTLMRMYFFTVPYLLMALALVLRGFARGRGSNVRARPFYATS